MLLTVAGNCGRLKDMEAILGLQGRDLSMRELGEELGLFVVLEVDVILRQVDFESAEGSSGTDLWVRTC